MIRPDRSTDRGCESNRSENGSRRRLLRLFHTPVLTVATMKVEMSTQETPMSDRKEAVRDLLKNSLRLDTSKLGDADPLFSSGLIDSFALLELITVLESTFSIRIDAEKATIENLDSIDGICTLIDGCS